MGYFTEQSLFLFTFLVALPIFYACKDAFHILVSFLWKTDRSVLLLVSSSACAGALGVAWPAEPVGGRPELPADAQRGEEVLERRPPPPGVVKADQELFDRISRKMNKKLPFHFFLKKTIVYLPGRAPLLPWRPQPCEAGEPLAKVAAPRLGACAGKGQIFFRHPGCSAFCVHHPHMAPFGGEGTLDSSLRPGGGVWGEMGSKLSHCRAVYGLMQ